MERSDEAGDEDNGPEAGRRPNAPRGYSHGADEGQRVKQHSRQNYQVVVQVIGYIERPP